MSHFISHKHTKDTVSDQPNICMAGLNGRKRIRSLSFGRNATLKVMFGKNFALGKIRVPNIFTQECVLPLQKSK